MLEKVPCEGQKCVCSLLRGKIKELDVDVTGIKEMKKYYEGNKATLNFTGLFNK